MIRRFNRYELKYLIHVSTYHRLVKDLLNFLEPDEYGDGEGFYKVTSLYYDSPDYSMYRSKVDGLKYRRKVRLRVYPDAHPEHLTHGFVEIKQRIDKTVQKRRVHLPLDDALRVCVGDFDPFELNDELDRSAAGEMVYIARAMNLRPSCVVAYRRRALVGGRYDPGMRLTFDSFLQGRIYALDLREDARNYLFLPPDWMGMEVKVNERVPHWVTVILARHGCTLQRISKYCAVLDNCMGRRRGAMEGIS